MTNTYDEQKSLSTPWRESVRDPEVVAERLKDALGAIAGRLGELPTDIGKTIAYVVEEGDSRNQTHRLTPLVIEKHVQARMKGGQTFGEAFKEMTGEYLAPKVGDSEASASIDAHARRNGNYDTDVFLPRPTDFTVPAANPTPRATPKIVDAKVDDRFLG